MSEWIIYLLVSALTLLVVLGSLGWLAWAICRWRDARRDRQRQAARAAVLARIAAGHAGSTGNTKLLGGKAVTPDGGFPAEVPAPEPGSPRVSSAPVSQRRHVGFGGQPPVSDLGQPAGRHAAVPRAIGKGGASVQGPPTASVSRAS